MTIGEPVPTSAELLEQARGILAAHRDGRETLGCCAQPGVCGWLWWARVTVPGYYTGQRPAADAAPEPAPPCEPRP